MSRTVKVARLDEMPPGTVREFQADGRMIALSNVEGELYAMDNSCLHRGGPLGQGPLEGAVLTCPWHGWQYDVKDGSACFNKEIEAKTYPVEVEGNDILVELD